MPDVPTQDQTPGQMLAGQSQAPTQTGNSSLASRLAQIPSAQQPVQPQAPTPQQAVSAHHNALGQVTRFLFGQQVDPQTGAPIRQPPGAIFRSLLAGALLGGSLGAQGNADGGTVGSFLGGMGRGASGVEQQAYQRHQQEQDRAMKRQQMTLEQQKFEEEKTQHTAALEHWNLENLARGREADYRDREQLEKEEAQEENIQRYAIANGAKLASIPHNDEPGNGPTLMKAMVNTPQAFAPPSGYSRLLTKSFDFSGLDHDKNGWTENGKPVNWADHMKWRVYYVPQSAGGERAVSMSGADWQKFYGVKGLDPAQTYNVDSVQHLVAAASSQRKNEREDFNQSFKEKHDALQATISSARTNVTQLNNEKRELIRQGFGEDSDELQDIQDKIENEQKREQDAIAEMHPKIRERVTKQAPSAPAQPSAPAAKPKAQKAPGAPPPGATMKVPGSDGRMHWSDGRADLGVAQ